MPPLRACPFNDHDSGAARSGAHGGYASTAAGARGHDGSGCGQGTGRHDTPAEADAGGDHSRAAARWGFRCGRPNTSLGSRRFDDRRHGDGPRGKNDQARQHAGPLAAGRAALGIAGLFDDAACSLHQAPGCADHFAGTRRGDGLGGQAGILSAASGHSARGCDHDRGRSNVDCGCGQDASETRSGRDLFITTARPGSCERSNTRSAQHSTRRSDSDR